MNKQKFKLMGYTELPADSIDGEIDTLYKRFDNGNAWVVQFNEEQQEDVIGMVYLTNEQVTKMFR